MKKIVRVMAFAFSLAIVLSVNSFAIDFPETELSRDNMIAALLDRGYPENLLETLDTSLLQDMYDDTEFNFKSYSRETYEMQDAGYAQTRGSIDSTELELTCIISDNGRDTLTVYYAYNWLALPAFRWVDTIAFSWDETLYDLVSGTFHRYDQYKTSSSAGAKLHDSGITPATATSSGITWNVDLKGYGLDMPTELFGYANFKLSGTPTESIFYSRYFHEILGEVLIVPIPHYGPIEIPSPASGDSRPLTTEYDPYYGN